MRKDILNGLDLPLTMVHGRIGALQITVPWSNLKNKPVIVAVRDVHVIVRPRTDVASDSDSEQRIENARKQLRLALHEELLQQQQQQTTTTTTKKKQKQKRQGTPSKMQGS